MENEFITHKDLIREESFLGEYPYESIEMGIMSQFQDYIGTADKNNYVDIFYRQWDASYNYVMRNDAEDHPVEKKEVLTELYDGFTDMMVELFDTHLGIGLNDVDMSINSMQSENVISALYEFFILGARRNFKSVISRSVMENMKPGVKASSDEFYEAVDEHIDELSSIMTEIHTLDFLEWSDDSGYVTSLFQNGIVNGNYLKKYSPRLYQNDEFHVDLISYITMYNSTNDDIMDLWND